MVDRPSPIVGFRLTLRLRKLVVAVWLVSLAALLPVFLVLEVATARTLSSIQARSLPAGDLELIVVELLRPLTMPLALALLAGVVLLFTWSVVWHGGTVRWWTGAGAARVRLAEIIGHGFVWWWRFARLWMTGNVVTLVLVLALWLGLQVVRETVIAGLWEYGLLVAFLSLDATVVVAGWLATLRGAWVLGEPGRRSSVLAWFRGLALSIQQPVRSVIPVVVWTVPAMILLALPAMVESPFAVPAVVLSWLGAAWCWVALFLSYAPQEPPDEWVQKMQARAAARAAKPRE